MKTKKDWADALQEQCFPEEVSPPEGSWADITGRMRRRSMGRKTMAAVLAMLVPVGAVLLFGPCQTVPDTMAELEQPDTVQAPSLLALQEDEPESPVVLGESFRPARIPIKGTMQPEGTPTVAVSEPSEVYMKASADTPSDKMTPSTASTVAPRVSAPVSDPFQWPDDEIGQPLPRKRRLSVNIHAGSAAGKMESNRIEAYPSGTNPHSKASEADLYNLISIVEQVPIQYIHSIPLSMGLNLSWELSPRVALESGLTYSYLHSYENLFGDQRLHFVGIPLKLNIRLFSAGPLEVGAGGYGMAEKCVSASQGRLSVKEPDIQWSSGAFMDAGYRIGNNVSLYLQPSMSYYFTKTKLLTYRTENPLGFSLQAGIRFHL